MFVASANATLIGDDVSCSTSGSSWSCDPSTAIVNDPLIEFGVMLRGRRAFDLDISSNSFNFDVLLSVGNIGGLGPISIFDIDSIITGYKFDTNIFGMDASRLSFTSSSFDVHFDNLSTQTGQYLTINLQPVPLPATMLLFGTGIAGLAGIRMREMKKGGM